MQKYIRMLCFLGFTLRLAAQTTVVLNPYAEVDWNSVEVHKANLHWRNFRLQIYRHFQNPRD